MFIFYFAIVAIQLAIIGGAAWAVQRLDWAQLRVQSIEWLGNFVADVLDHPRVKLVLAEAVTNGMNHTMEQPDLGMRLHKVSESMREDNLQMSRSFGEQLPALAKSFVGGAVSSMTKKKTKPEQHATTTKLLEQRRTAIEVSSLTLDSYFSERNVVDKKKQ